MFSCFQKKDPDEKYQQLKEYLITDIILFILSILKYYTFVCLFLLFFCVVSLYFNVLCPKFL